MERDDLEWLSALADARLGVAEGLGWFAALAVALLAGMQWAWWAGVIVIFPVFYVITLPYRNNAAKAEEAYFRSAKIGRYGYLRSKGDEET